jgi:MFS family permease
MRARVFSLQQVAIFVGGGIGLGLGGFVGDTFGWRWAFVVVGMPGSLLAIAAFRLREPVRGDVDRAAAGVQQQSTDTGVDAKSAAAARPSLGTFLRTMVRELKVELRFIFGIRTMRYILIGVSALLFTVAGIGYWLAVYHERFSGMSLTEATAFTAAVLAVGGTIGTFAGGALSDRLRASHGPASRIHIVVWSACSCAILFMISFAVASVPLRLGLEFVGVAAGAAAVPGLRAAMLDVIPASSRGVGASAFSLASIIFGTALAPPLVGFVSDVTGSLAAAFYIVFPPVIAGLLLLSRATKTIVDDVDAMIAGLSTQAPSTTDDDRL